MQLAAEFFHRRIVIYPVYKVDGLKFEYVPFQPLLDQTTMYLLYFSESRFIHGHYQSIRPNELQESTNPISAEESNGINHENDIIFQVPQADSTVMNSEENSKNSSNASTLPPPVQSFQDVFRKWLEY